VEGIQQRPPVQGKILLGCPSRKAKCPACKTEVTAIKPYEEYVCQVCGGNKIQFLPDSREGLIGLPYFILPTEVLAKNILEPKPSKLTIIPATNSIETTLPHSYTKYAKKGVRYCSSFDGKTARRYAQGGHKTIECSETCIERLNKSCKATATFYVILPAINMNAAFSIGMSTAQSIGNIIFSLTNFSNNGRIIRGLRKGNEVLMWTLQIIQKKRKETNSLYSILQLFPPEVTIDMAVQLQTQSAKLIGCS
jgi:hypothetical protein